MSATDKKNQTNNCKNNPRGAFGSKFSCMIRARRTREKIFLPFFLRLGLHFTPPSPLFHLSSSPNSPQSPSHQCRGLACKSPPPSIHTLPPHYMKYLNMLLVGFELIFSRLSQFILPAPFIFSLSFPRNS